MAKDPAFLMYSSDFLTGTFTMSDEQVGKYIRLLCLQHQKGVLTKADIDKVCKQFDKDIYDKFVVDGNMYYNQRLKEESEKRNAYCKSRSSNRLKRKNISNSYDAHMGNGDEDVNENENKNDNTRHHLISVFGIMQNEEGLIDAWNSWKEYKQSQFKFSFKSLKSELTSLKNLKNLSNGKEDIAIAIINQSIANGWKGLFSISKQQSQQSRYDARVEYSNRHNQ